MRIKVKQAGFLTVMNEDGEFRCPHDNHKVKYDTGGDGITEPGPSWSVYCYDCRNEDITQDEVDDLVEAYIEMQNDMEEIKWLRKK